MKAFLRRVGLGLVVILVILYGLAASYYLPRTELVNVTGTEIKRADVTTKTGATRTTDVRYVMTRRLDDGKAMVFRNEDTGWGWPPYFKFDSGDLAGEAMKFAKTDADATVLVTYYGWRTNLFSMFPNIVSMEIVGEGHEHVPVFNFAFLILSLIAFVVLAIYIRRLARWRPAKKGDAVPPDPEPVEPAEPAA